MVIPQVLYEEVKHFAQRKRPHALEPVVKKVSSELPGVQAVLFYGSCLQKDNVFEGLVDLYFLIGSYWRAYRNPLLAVANRLLPPNVFYLEEKVGPRVLRAKYAVMRLDHFFKATSPRWFHSYFWGRFCQPTALIYSQDYTVEKIVLQALSQAVLTFLTHAWPMCPPQGRIKTVWLKGLSLSYQAELRPEPKDRLLELWRSQKDYFLSITKAAAESLPFPVRIQDEVYQAHIPLSFRKRIKYAWSLRIVQGKCLSVLRLMKAACTFRGGVDYALWKIERHRGLRFEVPQTLRKHPLLALLVLGWKVIKEGGVR